MSQQSNPATLRDLAKGLAKDLEYADSGSELERDIIIETLEKVAALAASGTEAVPSDKRIKPPADVGVGCGCDEAPECTHSLYWWIGFKEGQKTLLLDQKDAASQAAASQVERREATCFAIAALEPNRLQSTDYKTGFIDAKNAALVVLQHPPAQAAASPEGKWREASEWPSGRPVPAEDCYIAWCRWNGRGYVICDSDAPKAFKVYRWAALRQSAAPSGGAVLITYELAEKIHQIIERHSTDVVDYELAADDINALLAQESKTGAAPSGALRLSEEILVDAARLIRRRKRAGADNEEIEGCAMVCDAMRDDSLAQESKTGAVTETK